MTDGAVCLRHPGQDGGDNADVTDMINNLSFFQHIEVDRASEAFTADSRSFDAGDYVVRMHQPYALTAKNLLSTQTFPATKTPYDVTTWTYGLMRDVEVVPLSTTLPAGLSLIPITEEVAYTGTLTGDVASYYAIEHQSNNNLAVALPRIWDDTDLTVSQADAPFEDGGHTFPAGTLVVHTEVTQTGHITLTALAGELGLTAYSLSGPVSDTVTLEQPAVGLYTANSGTSTTMPEGWTRLRLDRAGWDYTRLYGSDVQTGTLDSYDVIIIPPMTVSALVNGASASMPPAYRPGIGTAGVDKLKAWVEAGGTLVLQGRAANLPIDKGWGSA